MIVAVLFAVLTAAACAWAATTVTSIEVVQVVQFDAPPPATFDQEILALHNRYRQIHRAQPLGWNHTVAAYAQRYASQYPCSGTLTHSGGPYGENLAVGYSAAGAASAWYQEGRDYQYGTDSTYNHFTAMVWNGTTALGCAARYCNPQWGTYIVCLYYPPGNVVGQSAQNVYPPYIPG